MFRRVLITGGTGQIGSALQASAPPQVAVAAPSSRDLNVCDPASIKAGFAKWRPNFLVNAAGYTKVDQAEDEPQLAFAANAEGPRRLAEACAAASCPMLHLSTDYVFDGKKAAPYAETDPPAPLGIYGLSKLQGEREVAQALPAHLILRVSWVFSAVGANFVKTMLRLAAQREIRVVADQRGTPCAAPSIAAAIWTILHGLADGADYGLYHLASQPPTTWHGFAAAVFAAAAERPGAGPAPRLQAVTTQEYAARAPRPLNSVLDGTRLQRAFGIAAADWRPELAGVVRRLA